MKTEEKEVEASKPSCTAVNSVSSDAEITETMTEFVSGLAVIGQAKQGIVHIVVNEAEA